MIKLFRNILFINEARPDILIYHGWDYLCELDDALQINTWNEEERKVK
jgi:hypothetical protein